MDSKPWETSFLYVVYSDTVACHVPTAYLYVMPDTRVVECKLIDLWGKWFAVAVSLPLAEISIRQDKSYTRQLFLIIDMLCCLQTLNNYHDAIDFVFTTQLCCPMLTVQCTGTCHNSRKLRGSHYS